MIRETVQRIRGGEKDEYNDPKPGGSILDIDNCKVWPRMSSENAENGSVPIGGWNVFAPDGSDIQSGDTLGVRGKTYPVEGVPAVYLGKGVVVVTERVGG